VSVPPATPTDTNHTLSRDPSSSMSSRSLRDASRGMPLVFRKRVQRYDLFSNRKTFFQKKFRASMKERWHTACCT